MKHKNEIDVWIIHMSQFLEHETYLFSLLDEREKKRAKAFVTAELSSRYTISQGILRILLGEYSSRAPENVTYTFGTHRKPYLADNLLELHFNLSHSGDMALLGLSSTDEVGVDIERVNPQTVEKQLEKSVFSPHELQSFYSLPPERRAEAFFSAWTHKEALLKLAGVGLYKEMKEVEVPLSPQSTPSPVLYEDSQKYLRSFYVTHNYLGAIASPKPEFDIHLQTYELKKHP